MLLVILGAFALIALVDFLPILKKRDRRATAAFCAVFAAALAIAVLMTVHVEVPSAMKAWQNLIQSAGLAYPP